jgi:class 3 adenylate cyclase
MPEPQVRYCTTQDGVRIAYTVTGNGPPLLFAAEPVISHVQLEWSHSVFGRIDERLARDNTLIRFDPRGVGMSDRTPPTELEHALWDLEAVVDRLQLERFALAAVQSASLAVTRYAASHPDRVSRVAFIDGFLRNQDLFNTPQVRAFLSAAADDFETATEVIGAIAFGTGREESRTHGAYIRACLDQEFILSAPKIAHFDVTALVAAVTMPALVIRHEGVQYVTTEMVRDLVSRLPDARLVVVPGLWADDPAGMAGLIADFINEAPGVPTKDESASQSGVHTILFTDLASSTALTQRLGDAKAQELVRAHNAIVREALAANGGNEIKHTGDGIMASFPSASGALECAVTIQRAVAERDVGAHRDAPLQVHIGLNAGEPVAEEQDLFGTSVQLARRICDHAEPGQIVVSDVVRQLAAGKGFLFADLGEVVPKGFEEPVRLYEVRWREGD